MFNVTRLHFIVACSALIALTAVFMGNRPTHSAQQLVSPLIKLEDLPVPVEELYQIAMAEAKIQGLRGDPTAQQAYFLTQGQWLTANGLNIPEHILPDRNVPVYVLRITGDFNFVSHNGVTADMAEIVVHALERRILATGLKSSLHIRPIDLEIADIGYPQPPPAEVIEAHQFRDDTSTDEIDVLPIPEKS